MYPCPRAYHSPYTLAHILPLHPLLTSFPSHTLTHTLPLLLPSPHILTHTLPSSHSPPHTPSPYILPSLHTPSLYTLPSLHTLTHKVEALESGHVDTLFRGNSIACKVLSCSFKTFGFYYLQSVVRPLILQLMKSDDRDYEVDPTRLSDPSKLEQNQSNLIDLVQTFYTTILNSSRVSLSS